MRNAGHPRGFPWLESRERAKAEEANDLADFCLEMLRRAAACGVAAFREHPEALGYVRKSDPTSWPASIWQREDVRRLVADSGFKNVAFRQSYYAGQTAKPTRPLGNVSARYKYGKCGWPTFNDEGRYEGPLLPSTTSSASPIGKDEKGFRTSPSAACPPRLCAALADTLLGEVFLRLRQGERVEVQPEVETENASSSGTSSTRTPTRSTVEETWAGPSYYDTQGPPILFHSLEGRRQDQRRKRQDRVRLPLAKEITAVVEKHLCTLDRAGLSGDLMRPHYVGALPTRNYGAGEGRREALRTDFNEQVKKGFMVGMPPKQLGLGSGWSCSSVSKKILRVIRTAAEQVSSRHQEELGEEGLKLYHGVATEGQVHTLRRAAACGGGSSP